MTKPKPITDKGIIFYYDYEYILNFLNNEEKGILLTILLRDRDNPTLNPTDNCSINNAYNYIANRIIDYKSKNKFYSDEGKKGGNPTLTLKGTLNPTDNPTLKLKEKKIKEDKIKEIKIPTLEEVTEYAVSRNRLDLSKKFYDWYTTADWKDKDDNPIKNWKLKFISWESNNKKEGAVENVRTNRVF